MEPSLTNSCTGRAEARRLLWTLGLFMSDTKPTFIKIAPGANVTGLEATDNTIVGDAHFIDNHGTLENAKLERNRHIIPNAIAAQSMKRWFEKPFGIVFLGLVVAGIAYYLGWH